MEWLNFRHLFAFWSVARAGSFTEAARELHVAQSALSAQVAALEEYFGEPLFVRSHRRISLTPQGRELLGHAHAIFDASRTINAVFRDKETLGRARPLKLGVVGGASRNFVFRLLEGFTARVPDAPLAVSTGSYGELYGLIRRFELDAIITLEPPKKKDLGEISYQRIGESGLVAVAAPEIIRAIAGGDDAPRDVFKFRHPFEVDLLTRHLQPLVKGPLTLRLDTDDIPLLRFFANSGHGLVVMPRVGALEDLEAGLVEAIELPRCPEVFIYGITAARAEGAHPALAELWPERLAEPG